MDFFLEQAWFFLQREPLFHSRFKSQKMTHDLTISVLSVPKARMLNLKFRKKKYATDVLSFESEMSWGDMVLCDEVILKNAKSRKIPYREELAYVVLHGILHLVGFDHELSLSEEKTMFDLQDRVFNHCMSQIGSSRRVER